MSGIISDESRKLLKEFPRFKFLSIYYGDILYIVFIGAYDIIYTLNKTDGCTNIFYNDEQIKTLKISTQDELRRYFSCTKFKPFDYLYHIQEQIKDKYKYELPFKFKVRPGIYTFELIKHTSVPINETPTESREYILVNINHDNTFNICNEDSGCWMNSQKTIEYLYDNLYTTTGFNYIFYNY